MGRAQNYYLYTAGSRYWQEAPFYSRITGPVSSGSFLCNKNKPFVLKRFVLDKSIYRDMASKKRCCRAIIIYALPAKWPVPAFAEPIFQIHPFTKGLYLCPCL
jgi:hypothetical protein